MFPIRLVCRRAVSTHLNDPVRGGPKQTGQRDGRFQTSARVDGFRESNYRLEGSYQTSQVSLVVLLVVFVAEGFEGVAEGSLIDYGATWIRLTDAQRITLIVEETRPRRRQIFLHEGRQLSC